MKINLHVYLIANYYGIGLTPDDAISACVKAGGKKLLDNTRCQMHRIPQGACLVWVNDMGGVCWKFPEWVPEPLPEGCMETTRLLYDRANKAWVPEDESKGQHK